METLTIGSSVCCGDVQVADELAAGITQYDSLSGLTLIMFFSDLFR